MTIRNKLVLTSLSSLAIILGVCFFTTSAYGLSIDLNIDLDDSSIFVPPLVSVTLTDLGNDIKFDVTLTDGDLQWLYINADLIETEIVALSLTGTDLVAQSFGEDDFKADGDGYFDILADFGDGGSKLQSTSFTISHTSLNLSIDDFVDFTLATMSVGGPKGPFTMVAHVQQLGLDDNDSDWVGGGGGPVPEPATMGLLGLGLLGLGARHRRKRVAGTR